MTQMSVLGHLKILQYGSCRNNAKLKVFYTEAFKRLSAKVGK